MLRRLIVCLVLVAALVPAGRTASAAQQVDACSGVVYMDTNASGDREPFPKAGGEEVGVGAVSVRISDANEQVRSMQTGPDGRWIAPIESAYPLRVDFVAPDGLRIAPAGEFSGMATQYLDSIASCSQVALGNVGLIDPTQYCAADPELITSCFVAGYAEDHDEMAAFVALNYGTEDNQTTEATSAADWMSPLYRSVATVGQVGSVYGLAVGADHTVYAAAFVKRHSRLTSALNPAANPTVIYRVLADGETEIFVAIEPQAADPHGQMDGPQSYVEDLAAMEEVYKSGLGDLQFSSDKATLYTVDLGNRALVAVDATTGEVTARTPLTGARLGVGDCAVSEDRPAGDLRPFGLGLDTDGSLLVGIVCSAESTTRSSDFPVDGPTASEASGDHAALWGYVFDLQDDVFEKRLDWPLAGDRGRMQEGGGLAHDAAWHPWVDMYPFDKAYDQVAYPQPAITDVVVDGAGNLVVAMGDRWGHQTAPRTVAPAWDGATREVAEPLSSGDLVRACANEGHDGWSIEGSPSCPRATGGPEHFQDDRYGVHDETAFGSVAYVPGRDAVVATHMNPIPAADTWQAGGLIWHDIEQGRATKGVRLYDGRSADPEGTFEKASGLGSVVADCGDPPIQHGGSVWYDEDADGIRDAGELPIPGVTMTLLSSSGDALGQTTTANNGSYLFDNRGNSSGLLQGLRYQIVMDDLNFAEGGVLAPGADFVGLSLTDIDSASVDSDSVDSASADSDSVDVDSVGQYQSGNASVAHLPTYLGTADGVDHSLGFAMTDQYDLALVTTLLDLDLSSRIVTLDITVRNQGSVASGAFAVVDELPAGTSFTSAGTGLVQSPGSTGTVSWEFAAAQELQPGEQVSTQFVLDIEELAFLMTNRAEISHDSGDDDDSFPDDIVSGDDADPVIEQMSIRALEVDQPKNELDEDDHDIVRIGIGEIGGRVWDAGDDTGVDGATAALGIRDVAVQLSTIDGVVQMETETDSQGRYTFSYLLPGTYVVEVSGENFATEAALAEFDAVVSPAAGPSASRGSVTAVVELAGDSPRGEAMQSPSKTLDEASDLTVSFGLAQPVLPYQRWAMFSALGLGALLLVVAVRRKRRATIED